MAMIWEDGRKLDYNRYLSWGWSPSEAAWFAYYGKPFHAVLIQR